MTDLDEAVITIQMLAVRIHNLERDLRAAQARTERTMNERVVTKIELIAVVDGTFGARWSGDRGAGATWDHHDWVGVFTALEWGCAGILRPTSQSLPVARAALKPWGVAH